MGRKQISPSHSATTVMAIASHLSLSRRGTLTLAKGMNSEDVRSAGKNKMLKQLHRIDDVFDDYFESVESELCKTNGHFEVQRRRQLYAIDCISQRNESG